jgi:enamine deaminase RidA (YjgF/YER057c/UK114 family)
VLRDASAKAKRMTHVTPPGWPPPRGYSHGITLRGTCVFVAGQLGCDAQRKIVSDNFVEQAAKALSNVVDVLAAAGARPEHVGRMTWYVTDMREYLDAGQALGHAYRQAMGRHYPAMSAVQVLALVDPAAKVEIEATAVLPDAA